jgi:hypothetical protein
MYDFAKKQHRDLLAEACADMRTYQADGGAARHRLANSKPGTPAAGANVPAVLTIERVDGKWWGNKPEFGPFDTLREVEIAVYGRSDLSGDKRNPMDDAPKSNE